MRYLGRRILHPNLVHVCVAAEALVILRQAAGLGFSGRGHFWTNSDGQCTNASGRWRFPKSLLAGAPKMLSRSGIILALWGHMQKTIARLGRAARTSIP
jgi:hypothetical protein